jgi:RHS repeat-associated protein
MSTERKVSEFFLSAEYFNLELSMGCPKLTYLSAVRHDHPRLSIVKSGNRDFFFIGKEVAGAYVYGFNGMEKDDEVKGGGNHMTTPFRQYDARIGRWMTTDPIVHVDQSPYTAFNNNPIYYKDPSGLKGSGPDGMNPDEGGGDSGGEKVDVKLLEEPKDLTITNPGKGGGGYQISEFKVMGNEDQTTPSRDIPNTTVPITPGTLFRTSIDVMTLTRPQIDAYQRQEGFYSYVAPKYTLTPSGLSGSTVLTGSAQRGPNTTLYRPVGLVRTYTMPNFGPTSNNVSATDPLGGPNLIGITVEIKISSEKVAVVFNDLASETNYTGGANVVYKLNTDTGVLTAFTRQVINDPFDTNTPDRQYIIQYGTLAENEVLFFNGAVTAGFPAFSSSTNSSLNYHNRKTSSLLPIVGATTISMGVYNYK